MGQSDALKILYQLSVAMQQANSVGEVHEAALEVLVSSLKADRAAVRLFDAKGVMRFQASRGLSDRYRQAVEGHSSWKPGIRQAEPLVIPDAAASMELDPLRQAIADEGIAALAFVPLFVGGELVGKFMVCYDQPHQFSEEEIGIARLIARDIGMALARHRDEEALRNSGAQLELALAAGGLGTWSWDVASGTVHWSQQLEAIHGLAPGSFDGTFPAFQRDIHPDDNDRVMGAIRAAVEGGEPYQIEYRIRRPDDEVRWLVAQGHPVTEAGRVIAMIGVCNDITDRRRQEEGLELVAEASRVLFASLEPDATLDRFLRMLVPRLAGWAGVHLVDEAGGLQLGTVVHSQATGPACDPTVGAWSPVAPVPSSLVVDAFRTGTACLHRSVPEASLRGTAHDDELETLQTLGLRSVIVVPLACRGKTLGVMTLVAAAGRIYDNDDLAVAQELAQRAALAIDNGQQYQYRAEVAATLQRSFLPPGLPSVPGVDLAARYLPAADIGGDFYDVFSSGDDWVVGLGDVSGKGVAAATFTTMVRYSLRTMAAQAKWPSTMLAGVHQAITDQLTPERFCTLVCGSLRRRNGGVSLTVASAGHPLPLILRRDGTVDTFGTAGTLLAALPAETFTDVEAPLLPGEVVVFFTDGALCERIAGVANGEARLREVLAGCAALSAADVVHQLEVTVRETLAGSWPDDVALLVARIIE